MCHLSLQTERCLCFGERQARVRCWGLAALCWGKAVPTESWSAAPGAGPGAQIQPGWLRQSRGALHGALVLLGFLPAPGASDYRLQLLIASEGGSSHGESQPRPLSGLSVLRVLTAGRAGPWLAVSSFQQQPVASRQVGIKPLSLVCLYRPLKESSNRNWFHSLDLNIRAYPQRIQCTC